MSNNIPQNFDYNNIRFTNLPLPIKNKNYNEITRENNNENKNRRNINKSFDLQNNDLKNFNRKKDLSPLKKSEEILFIPCINCNQLIKLDDIENHSDICISYNVGDTDLNNNNNSRLQEKIPRFSQNIEINNNNYDLNNSNILNLKKINSKQITNNRITVNNINNLVLTSNTNDIYNNNFNNAKKFNENTRNTNNYNYDNSNNNCSMTQNINDYNKNIYFDSFMNTESNYRPSKLESISNDIGSESEFTQTRRNKYSYEELISNNNIIDQKLNRLIFQINEIDFKHNVGAHQEHYIFSIENYLIETMKVKIFDSQNLETNIEKINKNLLNVEALMVNFNGSVNLHMLLNKAKDLLKEKIKNFKYFLRINKTKNNNINKSSLDAMENELKNKKELCEKINFEKELAITKAKNLKLSVKTNYKNSQKNIFNLKNTNSNISQDFENSNQNNITNIIDNSRNNLNLENITKNNPENPANFNNNRNSCIKNNLENQLVTNNNRNSCVKNNLENHLINNDRNSFIKNNNLILKSPFNISYKKINQKKVQISASPIEKIELQNPETNSDFRGSPSNNMNGIIDNISHNFMLSSEMQVDKENKNNLSNLKNIHENTNSSINNFIISKSFSVKANENNLSKDNAINLNFESNISYNKNSPVNLFNNQTNSENISKNQISQSCEMQIDDDTEYIQQIKELNKLFKKNLLKIKFEKFPNLNSNKKNSNLIIPEKEIFDNLLKENISEEDWYNFIYEEILDYNCMKNNQKEIKEDFNKDKKKILLKDINKKENCDFEKLDVIMEQEN